MEEIITTKATTLAAAADGEPAKRGRGRPKGSTNSNKNDNDDDEEVGGEDDNIKELPQRTRNPPPKLQENSDSDEPSVKSRPKRRGPGRPSKKSDSEYESPHQPKRGPGRPSKMNKLDDNEHDDVSSKRGPGRPRKNDEEETTTTTTKTSSSAPPPPPPPPKTTQELHKQIKNSRDKLFFISYSHNKDPLVDSKKYINDEKVKEYHWYLVRVDLTTCKELDETKDCQKTGKYYVEFYTKASYDQGVLLLGNALENGIKAADMKSKPDSDSRYWLEWHEYNFDKAGDMIVGKWKEFQPNCQKAIYQRLMKLIEKQRFAAMSPTSGSGSGSEDSDGENWWHPDFDKYTAWADVVNLMDAKTRLVGPFDFVDDIKPPPLRAQDLKMFSDEAQKIYQASHSDLYVKDRVPLNQWKELVNAIKGKDITPPTIAVEKKQYKKKKQPPSTTATTATVNTNNTNNKRPRDETKDKTSNKKTRTTESMGQVCLACGKEATEKEPLLFFPATASESSFYIHVACGKKDHNHKLVWTQKASEELSSIVESALAQTRKAASRNGKSFYVVGELKNTLNEALESWAEGNEVARPSSSSVTKAEVVKKKSPAKAKPTEPLKGLHESEFTMSEIEAFPVTFAYEIDDPTGLSEENAKIATLDYEVEQRRMRRAENQAEKPAVGRPVKEPKSAVGRPAKEPKSKATPAKKPGSAKKEKAHPTVSEREERFNAEVAEEFPKGWTLRRIPRSGSLTTTKAEDTYYYSPVRKWRFRSRPEVNRFIECLKKSGGDEDTAIKIWK